MSLGFDWLNLIITVYWGGKSSGVITLVDLCREIEQKEALDTK